MLVNKTDYDLKYRLGLIADQMSPEIEFKAIDDDVERVIIKGGMEVERLLLEQNLRFSINLYYKLNQKEDGND